MDKKVIKKSLQVVGIAGLIASVGLVTGCSEKKSEGSCGQGSCGAQKADTAAVVDSTASCGQAADSTSSCGQ